MKKASLFLLFALFCSQAPAADISITATSVKNGGTAGQFEQAITFGATVTAGQPLYAVGDGTYKLCKADTAANAACVGVALTGGSTGQRGIMITNGGVIATGTTVVLGATRYCVSNANAGGIAPQADVAAASGAYITFIGYATTTTGNLQLVIEVTGLKVAQLQERYRFNDVLTAKLPRVRHLTAEGGRPNIIVPLFDDRQAVIKAA